MIRPDGGASRELLLKAKQSEARLPTTSTTTTSYNSSEDCFIVTILETHKNWPAFFLIHKKALTNLVPGWLVV